MAVRFLEDANYLDSVQLQVGSSSDLTLVHDGSNSYIHHNGAGSLFMKADTGNINIINYTNDADIILQSDNGAGGVTPYLTLDGSAAHTFASKNIRFLDSVSAVFGTSSDMYLFHDGSNGSIRNDTGDLTIFNNANDKDIIFQSDDGSGGVTTYFELDGSASLLKAYKNFKLLDGVSSFYGDSSDLQIQHDGSHSYISQGGTGNLYIQQNTNDADMVFQCDNGSGGTTAYLTLDGSTTHAHFSNPGNVGIGTTSPDHLLQVESSGNAEIQAQRVAGAGVLIQSQSAVGVVGTNTNHRLDLKTNNATRATISTSGNFGIGTTSPAQKLDVNGNANISGTLDVTATGSPLVRLYQSTTRRGFIQMNTSTSTLRVASEYGSVSLEAAATSGVDSDTSYIRIKPGGTVEIGAVDGDATISTDGSMTFKIDADNDETSQKFSFVNNAGTEVASIDESGNLTLTGGISASLPTSPGSTGTLWNDRGTVRVS